MEDNSKKTKKNGRWVCKTWIFLNNFCKFYVFTWILIHFNLLWNSSGFRKWYIKWEDWITQEFFNTSQYEVSRAKSIWLGWWQVWVERCWVEVTSGQVWVKVLYIVVLDPNPIQPIPLPPLFHKTVSLCLIARLHIKKSLAQCSSSQVKQTCLHLVEGWIC